MSYASYQPIVAAAAGRSQIWRLLIGVVTVVAVLVVWILAAVLGIELMLNEDEFLALDADRTPFGTAYTLFGIIGLGFGTWVAARLWHGRGMASLIGNGARTLRHFVLAVGVTFAVTALLWLVYLPFVDAPQPNLDVATWLRWLPLALVLILLQTGAEEVLFRGYLQSQLAARFKSPVVWLGVPSLLFGACHFLPVAGEINPGLVYVFVTFVFGLIAGDLTARTGTLGAAWGLHFATNCVALLIFVYAGSLSGLGLYIVGTIEEALSLSPLLLLDMIGLFLVYFVLRRLVTA